MDSSTTLVSDAPKSPLYSGVAVRVFSFFFSPIAGGILTAQNLKDNGQATAARKVLWTSIGGMMLLMGLLSYLPGSGGSSSISIGVGVGGGLALEIYAKKYIVDWKEHPTKRIWKPLLICFAITLPILALIIYGMEQPTA